MLDSSVRVSRRAGWKTDLLALDCRRQLRRPHRNCPTRSIGSTGRTGRYTTEYALSTAQSLSRPTGHRNRDISDPIDTLRRSTCREHITRDNEQVTAWLPCSRLTLPLSESFHRSGHHRRTLWKCMAHARSIRLEQSSQTVRQQATHVHH